MFEDDISKRLCDLMPADWVFSGDRKNVWGSPVDQTGPYQSKFAMQVRVILQESNYHSHGDARALITEFTCRRQQETQPDKDIEVRELAYRTYETLLFSGDFVGLSGKNYSEFLPDSVVDIGALGVAIFTLRVLHPG